MRIDDDEFKARYRKFWMERKTEPLYSLAASMSFHVKTRKAFIEMLRANGEVVDTALEPEPLARRSFREWVEEIEGRNTSSEASKTLRITGEEYHNLLAEYLKEQNEPSHFSSMSAAMVFRLKARKAFDAMLDEQSVIVKWPPEPEPLPRKPFNEWLKDN